MRRSIFLFILSAALLGQERYDLGGPCVGTMGAFPFAQIQAARKAGESDRLIELEKEGVRTGCSIAARWQLLANALVEVNRRQEAIRVLAEMDARGFDLSPSALGSPLATDSEALLKFMATPEFLSSGVGKKVGLLQKESDERRLRFRAMLAKLPPNQKPPENYVARGACPFECCTYREWTVDQDTDLVAAPGSREVVGHATKGTRVRAMTGEVHLEPQPVVVLRDGEFPKNSIVFVLDYEGEGFGHVWSRGRIASVFLGVRDYCFRVSDSCWGETLFRSSQRKPSVWWVKIRLPNGTIGWSDKAAHFGNQDLCG